MSGTINRNNFKPNKTQCNNQTYKSYEDYKVAVYSKDLYDSLIIVLNKLKEYADTDNQYHKYV